jgi:hypothetical protein
LVKSRQGGEAAAEADARAKKDVVEIHFVEYKGQASPTADNKGTDVDAVATD